MLSVAKAEPDVMLDAFPARASCHMRASVLPPPVPPSGRGGHSVGAPLNALPGTVALLPVHCVAPHAPTPATLKRPPKQQPPLSASVRPLALAHHLLFAHFLRTSAAEGLVAAQFRPQCFFGASVTPPSPSLCHESVCASSSICSGDELARPRKSAPLVGFGCRLGRTAACCLPHLGTPPVVGARGKGAGKRNRSSDFVQILWHHRYPQNARPKRP